MIQEPKNVDFVTTGRQPSEADFARISEWIRQDKSRKKSASVKTATTRKRIVRNQANTGAAKAGEE